MEIFVSRNGETFGPYDEQQILDAIQNGTLSEDDLALIAGTEQWIPLRSMVQPEAERTVFRQRINEFIETIESAALVVRATFLMHPAIVGGSALLFGCILMVLSQWPILIYGPFLVGSIIAGVILFRNQKLFSGISIVALSIILPLVIRDRFFPPHPTVASNSGSNVEPVRLSTTSAPAILTDRPDIQPTAQPTVAAVSPASPSLVQAPPITPTPALAKLARLCPV